MWKRKKLEVRESQGRDAGARREKEIQPRKMW